MSDVSAAILDRVSELARTLRTWRDRVRPEDVGLAAGPRRRAVGLRREELAALASVSTDYLVRLEQGRAVHPSSTVVDALARALRLTEAEHEHLLRLAGHSPADARRIRRHMTPALQRIADRLDDLPVLVFDRAWTLQSANALGTALVGDWSALPERERNIAWRHFVGLPGRVARPPAETESFESELVGDLQTAIGRYPEDPELQRLTGDLRTRSPRFAALWEACPVAVRASERKVVDHPEVGRLELDCDVLRSDGTDLVLVVYSAQPGSPDAETLRLLRVIGLQRMGEEAEAGVAPARA